MPTVLVTGANRGMGLEFCKQYAQEGWKVLACCRQPDEAQALKALQQAHSNIEIFRLDITSAVEIAQLVQDLHNTPIDILINNAGISHRDDFNIYQTDHESILRLFISNALGPLDLTKAFINQIAASQLKKIIYLSSNWASIAENFDGGFYAYRSSKAAGNCLMKNLSLDLKPRKIQVIMLHPGWVKTAMGGPSAMITAEASVNGMRRVIENVKATGVFYSYDGKEMPW